MRGRPDIVRIGTYYVSRSTKMFVENILCPAPHKSQA